MQATSALARRTTLVQFVVLKREDKWVVKSKELERVFSAQHKAVEAAIKLANDSGKDGKPAVVLFQKTKSDFQKVWTYGESAYPPSKLDLRIGSAAPQPKEAVRAGAPRDSRSPPGELQSDVKEPA
jgi:hypothetical protein